MQRSNAAHPYFIWVFAVLFTLHSNLNYNKNTLLSGEISIHIIAMFSKCVSFLYLLVLTKLLNKQRMREINTGVYN